MPAPLSDCTRFALNLYTTDIAWFKRRYGRGFSEEIRNLIHKHVSDYKALEDLMPPKPAHYLEEDFDD